MRRTLISGAFVVIAVIILAAHYSMLHNVDLSWNAKHLDLEDNNSFITADISTVYSRALFYLFIEPILIIIYSIALFIFIVLAYSEEEKDEI